MTTRDKLIISLRIKGFGKPEPMSEALSISRDSCVGLIEDLKSEGLVEDTRAGSRLTPAGRQAADALLHAERTSIEPAAIEKIGETFTPVNSAFKHLITRWQMREIDGKQVRNDHADLVYDGQVIDELGTVNAEVGVIINNIKSNLPRFDDYRRRLDEALMKIRAGELRYMAAPDAESYHTVWFELHQDLIGLLGTTRAKEAAAGRAV
jgi:hypothetical protein